MHPLLNAACAQADALTSLAVRAEGRWGSRLSPRNTIANAAPRRLGRAPALISTEGSWFTLAWEEDGFLNFALSPAWFSAAAEVLPEAEIAPPPPPPPEAAAFPAFIHPWDWQFLTVYLGREPSPAEAARQDGSNPGWLVRCAADRLEALEGRCPAACRWTDREQSLLLDALRAEEHRSPKGRARAKARLAERVWREKPETLPLPLNRFLRSALRAGHI